MKRVVIDTSALLTSIATSLGKFDKDSQKEFLIKLRSDIDKLISKYAFGGLTDGGVQVMNVQQSNMSSSSVNPSHFGNGGGVHKTKARYQILGSIDANNEPSEDLLYYSTNNKNEVSDLVEKALEDMEKTKFGKSNRVKHIYVYDVENQEDFYRQFADGGVIIAGVPHKIEMDRDISELKLLGAKRIELSHPRGDVYALDNKGYVNIGYDFYSFDLKDLPKIKKAYYSGKYAQGGGVQTEWVVKMQNEDSGDIETINVLAKTEDEAIENALNESGLSSDYYIVYSADKMARGGGVGEYNQSWHQDHYRHNKGESYEVPVGSRKHKYSLGGTLLSGMVGAYVGYQYGKKGKKAFKFEKGGVVGQEIVFDDNGEENTGVIKDIHENTGDYIVNTDDGRTVLAQLDRDVISLGGMRKQAPMEAPRKRFGFFEEGGEIYGEPIDEWFEMNESETSKILNDGYFDYETDETQEWTKIAESDKIVYYTYPFTLEEGYIDDDYLTYFAVHKPSGTGGWWEGHSVDFMPFEYEYQSNNLTYKHPKLDSLVKQHMAKGGLTEHGLKEGDKIRNDFSRVYPDDKKYKNVIDVVDRNNNIHLVDLNKGERYD